MMGEAKNRGSQAERREQAIERQLEEAEVLIFLKADEGKLNIGTLPRDDPPNQDSPAVIFAAYINANFNELAGQAMALYMSHGAAERGEVPHDGTVLAAAPTRSIVDPGGNIASEDVGLLGPDGRPMQ